MAELKNVFTWSFSAASDFDECRRKRYWSKYGAWGGWSASASPVARTAYRLSKMDSRYTLLGRVVEEAAMWMLRQQQGGHAVTPEAAYETVARGPLNEAWKQSHAGAWRADPKRATCLHEHYYPDLHATPEKEWTATLRESVQRCLANFHRLVLPRLAAVQPADEVAIDTPGKTGKVEGFEWEGCTVFAVPDYVYRVGDQWHIHDWKAGRPRPEHETQVALYALWAHRKHGVPADRITVYLEYLQDGQVAAETCSADRLAAAEQAIRDSVMDMVDYLEDGDPVVNKPRPREEWDMTPDRQTCRTCNFYELCKPEFEA